MSRFQTGKRFAVYARSYRLFPGVVPRFSHTCFQYKAAAAFRTHVDKVG